MNAGFELFAAQSFSKNFGLYGKLHNVIWSHMNMEDLHNYQMVGAMDISGVQYIILYRVSPDCLKTA